MSVRFGENDVELEVNGSFDRAEDLPTLAMRERVALCEGWVDAEP